MGNTARWSFLTLHHRCLSFIFGYWYFGSNLGWIRNIKILFPLSMPLGTLYCALESLIFQRKTSHDIFEEDFAGKLCSVRLCYFVFKLIWINWIKKKKELKRMALFIFVLFLTNILFSLYIKELLLAVAYKKFWHPNIEVLITKSSRMRLTET